MTKKLDFAARVLEVEPAAMRAASVRTVMLNVGRRCDLACAHCHHRCSPSATESMPFSVMLEALDLAAALRVGLVDVTGGSPELWPLLPALVEHATDRALAVRVRTNLVPLGRDQGESLVPLLAEAGVTLLASLPETGPESPSGLRPGSVPERLLALRRLADAGYGGPGGPALEIAVNPELGLPRSEGELAEKLAGPLRATGVSAGRVRSIANVPLGRYGDRLEASGQRQAYLHKLADAFEAGALACLPCRTGIAVAWDGRLFDCDFNLSAGLPARGTSLSAKAALRDPDVLLGRAIAFAPHCFACTVGAGSG